MAYLALSISAIAWETPTQRPEAHRYPVKTCEMAVNSATELFRESSINFPFLQANDYSRNLHLQRVWLSADKWTGSESWHHWCTTKWAEWHSCETLLFGLREASYWPKIGLRSNLIAPKFQNFPGGACPQAPLGCSILACARTTNLITPNLMTTALYYPAMWYSTTCSSLSQDALHLHQ